MDICEFKGKFASAMDLVTPAGTGLDRLIIIGAGGEKTLKPQEWTRLGGAAAAQISRRFRNFGSPRAARR